jgi:hypothetical protein
MEAIEKDDNGYVVGYTAQGNHDMTRFRVENGEMELVIGFKKFKLTTLFGRIKVKEVAE